MQIKTVTAQTLTHNLRLQNDFKNGYYHTLQVLGEKVPREIWSS